MKTTKLADPARGTGGDARGYMMSQGNPAGAPPLDWHTDDHPEDGDWLWKLSTQPYSGKVPTTKWVPIDRSEAEAAGVHADDIRRTASPDCPRHGDLPGQVPSALRGGRASGSSNRNGRSGVHPDQVQLDGFAPTEPTHEPTGSATDPTTATSDPQCSPAATPRSSASNRTGRAPATIPAGTPSARTTADTDGTSASPESSEPDPGTDASSTSPVDSPASLDTRTTPDTADIPRSERPCSCSFHKRTTEYSSHYATYPLTLPKRLIEAMCPLKVCRTCGVPSERVTRIDSEVSQSKVEFAAWFRRHREAAGVTHRQINEAIGRKAISANYERTDKFGAAVPSPEDWKIIRPLINAPDDFDWYVLEQRSIKEGGRSTVEYHVDGTPLAASEHRTKFDRGGVPADGVGTQAQRVAPQVWSDCGCPCPTCDGHGYAANAATTSRIGRPGTKCRDCGGTGKHQWRTGVVLDPFAGSGTTLEAAQAVGRHGIGIDLDDRNADLAQQRVGMFLDIDRGAA